MPQMPQNATIRHNMPQFFVAQICGVDAITVTSLLLLYLLGT